MQSFTHSFHMWARLIHIKFLYSLAPISWLCNVKMSNSYQGYIERWWVDGERASCDIPLLWKPHNLADNQSHDDVIKWKHFPRYWPFVWGLHRSSVISPHKDQWRGALMYSLISVWIECWVNNRDAGDLRRYRAHYDVIVMQYWVWKYLVQPDNKHHLCQCWPRYMSNFGDTRS